MSEILLIGARTRASSLGTMLHDAGYQVSVGDYERLNGVAFEHAPSAIVLHDSAGFAEVVAHVRCLRHQGYHGALFVLCLAGSVEMAQVLDAGADECAAPHADERLTVAKLRAVLRRSKPEGNDSNSALRVLADEVPRAVYVGATTVRLTPTEARILNALRKAKAHFVRHTELASAACPEAPLSRECLHVHLVHLRRKLGIEEWRLQNARAQGYRFVEGSQLARAHLA